MPSTVLSPPAARLVALAEGLSLTVQVVGHQWAPRDLDNPAAAMVVEMPSFSRNEPDTADDAPLGADGWRISYPLTFYFEITEASASQARAVETVEAFTAAVDDDPDLNGTTFEAKVTAAKPQVIQEASRALIEYALIVECLSFV